ncbi:MAG: hypothetical protein QOC88_1167 [Mycobacterium sp.]|jgi:hypothetical protein|nr:hypothetical protein [Mycobacterium sp.]MDT5164273.1 hypothetical protein [Mycobacterium sp.]
MSRIPLADIDQQSEPIREFVARRGALNVFRVLANAPGVLMLNALDVDLDEDARLPIPPRREPT